LVAVRRSDDDYQVPGTIEPGTAGPAVPADPLRYWRRQAWGSIAVGVGSLVVLALAIFFVDRDADDFRASADRAPGTVVDVSHSGGPSNRGSDSIAVDFSYRGVFRHSRIHVVRKEEWEVGQQVTVLVDPDDPGHVTVPGESNHHPVTEFLLFGVPALIAVVALLVGFRLFAQIRASRRSTPLYR
jgi:hypothetical protein